MSGGIISHSDTTTSQIKMKRYFEKFLGQPGQSSPPRRPASEIFWSWLASFVGIYAVHAVNGWIGIAESDSLYLIGSFGASAVLIYGAPAADFSQPAQSGRWARGFGTGRGADVQAVLRQHLLWLGRWLFHWQLSRCM